ncbi:hypothetical protein GGP91_002281 [Salinibacter ruber]|uniref:Uncharacterized protein n=2 Tax=Salinibacter ruber TaxID=146919 RepID=A0A9X2U1F6_9BACT|nr:DUF5687 family protein [Salinibacter ruber]MCS3662779.1 hypothetical protein [Salinibacter ruber]MCS3705449.1 hypothetical protein [Salinibacter ruber]MCS3830194.1 hypothetical protein [Salinibacter ruber]MCS3857143.1 hypothetical protein [Salinibacter ruber]MCS3863969.1 hypothetical protein [Salinibacter ruber]
MALWTLLRHRLQAAVRAPFAGRQVLSLILGGFLALYLGGGLVLVGLAFDDLVREAAPGADPLSVAAKGLLPFGLGYSALRVVMESGLGVDPRPYQALPVPRSALAGLLAVFAPLSLWNAVPPAFIVAVGVEGALNGTGGAALCFGLAGLGVLAAVTYAAPMLRRAASDRPFRAAGAVGLLVAAAAIEAVDLGVGLVSLVDVSAWLFGGVVRGDVLPTSVAALGLIGLVGGYVQWLQGAMVVDRSRRRASSRTSSAWLDRLARRGPVWREAVLEARLLLRNAQTRWTFFTALFFVLVLSGFAVLPIEAADLREAPPMELINMTVFPGLFATGVFAIYHGQNLFSYEGTGVEACEARPVSARHRMGGKLLFLEVGTLFCFLIPLPTLLLSQNPFLIVHTTFFLYNAGVVVPAMIAGATFNRKALEIDQRSFSQTNFSGGRVALTFPLLAVPFLFLFSFDRLVLQFGGVAALGLLSLLALPVWLRGLTRLYDYNRHAMLRGFRASRE